VIRLLLVDDDPLVRRGLSLILGGETDIEIVGEAVDGVEAEAAVRELAPDVVLMDVRMPAQDGVVTAEHLLARPDPPAIIMLTTFHMDDLVLRALGAGVSGFILKDAAPDKVIAAIRSVSAGEPAMSPTVARQVITAATNSTAGDAKRESARAELDVLTPRELDVAMEISRGASNAEIAARLFISVPTVKATVTRIFLKLETDNRVTIALRVRDAGLL
jgi:DNA-binding NarL/FixJ family response regulator